MEIKYYTNKEDEKIKVINISMWEAMKIDFIGRLGWLLLILGIYAVFAIIGGLFAIF